MSDTPLPPAGWTPGENVIREALKAVARNALRPDNLRRSLDDAAARLDAVDRRAAAEWLSGALEGLVLPLFGAAAYGAAGPAFGTPRSGHWPALARRFLAAHPDCAACGTRGAGVVPHHVVPVHVDPSKELDEANLIPMCPVHHLWVAHLGAWASWNSDVRGDAEIWRQKILHRPHPPVRADAPAPTEEP